MTKLALPAYLVAEAILHNQRVAPGDVLRDVTITRVDIDDALYIIERARAEQDRED